jgi:hypothetical protein
MSNGTADQGIQLGEGGDGGGMSMPMGGGEGGPSYPGLSMSSDNPEMGEAPEEGSATIHFHKHSHTRERHPAKEGAHKHHVHLKVHSIRFHKKSKPKVSRGDIEEALATAGGGAPGGGGPPPAGAGDGGEPPPPMQ